MNKFRKFMTKKSTRYSTNAALLTVIVLAILVVVNVFVAQFDWRFDVTAAGTFSLSDETKELLAGLTEDITVTAFLPANYTQQPEFETVKNTLTMYEQESSRLKVTYADPEKDPTAITRIQQYGADNYCVVFEQGERVRIALVNDMLLIDPNTGDLGQIQAEQQFTNAIYYVTTGKSPVLTMTTGHGEGAGDEMQSLLRSSNYTMKSVNLLTEEIPEDTDYLMIMTPTYDFDITEIQKLEAYFNQGKKAALYIDYAGKDLPQLEGFLSEWGIALGKDIVLEGDQSKYYMHQMNIFPSLASHELMDGIEESITPVVVQGAQSLEILFSDERSVTNTPLMTTSEAAFGRVNMQDSALEKIEGDHEGPLTVAVLSERITDSGSTAQWLVMGASSIYQDGLVSMNTFGNQQFLLNSVNQMADNAEQITIAPKDVYPEMFAISVVTALVWAAIVVIVIPILVIVFGIILYIRRKNA